MKKEEFIKMIENITIEEIYSFNITYFDEEENKYSSTKRKEKNIDFSGDSN